MTRLLSKEYYKQSLCGADNSVNAARETKALKDVVGACYEVHRAKLYTEAGFRTVGQQKMGFAVDIAVYDSQDNLLVLEETKGHYVDKCFFERALVGFCKSIRILQKQNKPIPILLLHSFCKYNQSERAFNEFCDVYKGAEVIPILKEKFEYKFIHNKDRKPKTVWFSQSGPARTPYSEFAIDALIEDDIRFITSLRQ
jgi:hypothetical protein